MSEVFIYGSASMALAVLLSQIVAAFRFPISIGALALRVPLFVLSAFLNWLGLIMAAMANYCESNCHGGPLNGPTFVVCAALLSMNTVATWLAWFVIPTTLRRRTTS